MKPPLSPVVAGAQDHCGAHDRCEADDHDFASAAEIGVDVLLAMRDAQRALDPVAQLSPNEFLIEGCATAL